MNKGLFIITGANGGMGKAITRRLPVWVFPWLWLVGMLNGRQE
ncbi:MAG: hypothetical protein ACLSDJ_02965 [Butyricimonas faecihominis]